MRRPRRERDDDEVHAAGRVRGRLFRGAHGGCPGDHRCHRRTGRARRPDDGRGAGPQHRRHRRDRAGARAGAGRRAGGDFRGERREPGAVGRQRHPPAQPAGTVAAGDLHGVGSERFAADPRYRYGRRQSRAGKLGRGADRRRLSLARGHRPQRTGRDRPGRGAARSAGHAGRPQFVRRPDLGRQQAAKLHLRRQCRGDLRQFRFLAAGRRGHRADQREPRLPARRRLCEARRFLQRSGQQDDDQRPRPFLRARAVGLRTERRDQLPPDRRLYEARRKLLRGDLCQPDDERIHRQPDHAGRLGQCRRRRGKQWQQHHQRVA